MTTRYAAFLPQGITADGSLRIVRRPPAIDARRIASGLTAARPKATSATRPTTTAARTKAIAPRPAAKKRIDRSQTCAVLVMACAPGISRPVTLVGERDEAPEFITARAWRAALEVIAKGRHVPIQIGHQAGAKILTTTASPRVRMHLCPTAGLCLSVDVRGSDEYITRTAAVSISFKPTAHHTESLGGQRVRFIDAMQLEHFAILPGTVKETPAYPLARVRRYETKGAAAGMVNLRIDVGCLIRAAWPDLKPSTRG
jgi:hypothetical protein